MTATADLPVAHVIFTTHWDREWVQTFEQYRFRLVGLIDRLMAILDREPDIRFVFDGQSVVIEDYLEIRPECRAHLQALAQAGRIVFGPWYVLADQFLEGDEATIRNLQLGMRLAGGFGGPLRHGYIPDSFGSIAVLPAIMSGFGIGSVNFGRGAPALDQAVFRWCWKDGSEVLALNRGYGNALSLAHDDLWRDLAESDPSAASSLAAARALLPGEGGSCPAGPIYLSTGLDHMEMRAGMGRILDALNEAQLGWRFTASDPAAFAADTERSVASRGQTLTSITGEMRGSADRPMDLQGVLSTNREIKRLNRLCELILSRTLEPLELAHHARTGTSHAHFLWHAWKLLVQNHPHDSICACSRDEVIVDMHARFQHILQLHELMAERILRELLPQRPSTALPGAVPGFAVFNGILRRGRAHLSLRVRIPVRLDGDEWDVVDATGTVVGRGVTVGHRSKDLETFYATNHDLGALACKAPQAGRAAEQIYTLVDIDGVADLGQAAGFSLFTLQTPAQGRALPTVEAAGRMIANDRLALVVTAEGSLRLTDRVCGTVWDGLSWFEDCADRGDTYDFQPLSGDVPVSTRGGVPLEVSASVIDERTARLVVMLEFGIPQRFGPNGRSHLQVKQRLECTYVLRTGCARVEARVAWVNEALQHRLRVGWAFESRPEIRSGGHFAALDRAWTSPDERFPCRPLTDWLQLGDGPQALAIITRGLYEFEARTRGDGGGDLLITLIRSVDSIGPAAGCNLPVTHAKELGAHVAEFAFGPTVSVVETIHQASSWLSPLLAEGFIAASDSGELSDLPRELLWCDDAEVVHTCLKRSADASGTIVRFFNPGIHTRTVAIRLGLAWTTVEQVDLAELPIDGGAVQTVGRTIHVAAPPHVLITLLFR